MQRGTTLPEMMVVLTIVGVLAVVTFGRTTGLRDRMSVRAAATETIATFALARRWSVTRATRTAIVFDTTSASVIVKSFDDTVAHRKLASSHGVSLTASRDSMAYAPNGLGYGASNLTLILTRGTAAETIFVSRLGRVRR